MKHTLFAGDHNIAMQYEGLARAAFDDCSKGHDPFNITRQEAYDFKGDDITEPFRQALIIVLTKLVIDNPANEALKQLHSRSWVTKTQTEAINLIEETIAELGRD